MFSTLADRIAEAERLSLALVALTEHERGAYFTARFSDPYSRPTYERAHRRAKADWDAAFELFDVAATRLAGMGMGHFARNLTRTTWQRVLVAFDLAAHAALQPGKESARDPKAPDDRTDQEAEACLYDEMPGLPDTDPAQPAGRAQQLLHAPAPRAEGGETCL